MFMRPLAEKWPERRIGIAYLPAKLLLFSPYCLGEF
jgi:hypothetical protein